MTKAELQELEERPMDMQHYYPCHTQTIELERAVKGMTAAADAVCGAERRDGFIRDRVLHLELVPRINSKQDLTGMSTLSPSSLTNVADESAERP